MSNWSGVTAAQLGVAEASDVDRGTASALYFSIYYSVGAVGGYLPGLAWERFHWIGVAARHHVVHQPRQITGQRQCRCRSADHQRCRDWGLGPSRDEPGERQPAVEFAEFRGNVERRGASELFGLVRKRQFVFVDVAERDDARQHHRIGP